MKWVVLGDIGQRDYYHLGDEAMTEVAIEMLRQRGATNIVLVASDPSTATAQHGLSAVRRINFEYGAPREVLERVLSEVTAPGVLSTDADATSLNAALRDADFALIAGGGNMNSLYPHLLYERVAFARIAQYYGVPLFVTSQTVGPTLRDRDHELVAELLRIAVAFGAREASTALALRRSTDTPEKVVHTYDDAVLLPTGETDRDRVAILGFEDAPIIASFAAEQGTSGIDDDEYVSKLILLLDDLADRYGKQVVLVPHAGSFAVELPHRDQGLNARIAEGSRTRRLISAPMLTARENVALVNGAFCSISSRYHPVVFGPCAGVPTVGVSLSDYSSVRMRGALANVGRERFVVPSVLWDSIVDACSEAIDLGDLLPACSEHVSRFQHRWWDEIVAAARRGSWSGLEDLEMPSQVNPAGEWSVRVEAATPAFELWSECAQRLEWSEENRAEMEHWRDRALAAEQRKVVRAFDSAIGVFRRARRD